MDEIKIREDKLDRATWYKCDCCGKIPSNNDIIITTEINYEYITVCSEECLMDYLKEGNSIIKKQKIVTYKKPNIDILFDMIQEIKSGEKLTLDDGTEVQYFSFEDMYEHYIVKNGIFARMFNTPYDVAQYLDRNKDKWKYCSKIDIGGNLCVIY